MFSSLKIKNFRLYWTGMFISLIGTWIQTVAQSWLVFTLTHSAFLLGLVGFLGALPVSLFSLFGGVVADRTNKRTILLVTQHVFMLLAFVLAVLTQLKVITPAQIMVIAFLNGIVIAFDAPCRQSVVVELVGKQHLLNAIALNSAAFNSARIIGPAIAGVLVSTIGMSGCFYINGISFLAVIAALFLLRIESGAKRNGSTHFMSDLVDGLRFIKHNRTILILISIVGVTSMFGISYVILMPVFAAEVLHVGIGGLGALMSAAGAGALAAALFLAKAGDLKRKGPLMLGSGMIFSLGLVAFGMTRVYWLSLASLVVVGWGVVTAVSLVNTLLQVISPDEFRGRLMSAFMFTFAGIVPFGNLLAGSLSHVWGVSFALALGGLVCGVFFVAVYTFSPGVRSL